MSRRFSFRPYRRFFRQPLRTAHGLWSMREGFIVRCEVDGQVGFGEVAPLPDFGTETVAAAAGFLQGVGEDPDPEVPADLPCCAFGLSVAAQAACSPASAVDDGRLGAAVPTFSLRDVAALLPAGASAESTLQEKASKGYRSFKWKVGVESLADELALLERLLASLPAGGRLRLDANGGLSVEQAQSWLRALDAVREQVEFLEQPLPVGQEERMAELMERSGVEVALDESLNGPEGAHWLRRWQGPLVVKPLLMGDYPALVQRLGPLAGRVVLSSVFETAVGRANVAAMAAQLPGLKYAIGFDTADAFDDELNALTVEDVWNELPHSN